jgi:FSR family fosmidomycin resistance protein-like MFS transporter
MQASELIGPAAKAEQEEAPEVERRLVLWLTNISHAVNHFQNNMVAALYPVIMAELGFSYFQLGIMSAIRSIFGNASQGLYGFVTPFSRRTHLLGIGNMVLGLGTLLTGLVSSFGGFVLARTVTSIGSSAQHPVGASLLSGYFPKNRGAILALNSSIANIGSLLAPAVAGVLLLVLGWRQIFFVVAVLSLLMGAAYFVIRFHDRAITGESKRTRLARGKNSYLRALRNRNIMIISLVQMVGAAGGEGGVNQTYLGPHLVNDFGLSFAVAGIALSAMQLGSIVGPVGFGWLSDRVSRKRVMQASLLLSAIGTLSIAYQAETLPAVMSFLSPIWPAFENAFIPLMLVNLFIYGAITFSRQTLTQAMVADSLHDEDRDAAFSLYYFIAFMADPIWALITGALMETVGFTAAFSRLALSYVLGLVLLTFIHDPRE